MRIAIDARMLTWTGIGRYTKRLLDELQRLDHDNQYQVLLQSKDWDKWQPTTSNFTKVRADFEPYSLRGLFQFGSFLRRLKPDLVHFTSQNTPLMFSLPHVSTVHDLTLVDYKNVRGNALVYEFKYWLFKQMMRGTVLGSNIVITPTDYGRRELLRRYRVPANQIVVTNEAADKLQAGAEPIERFAINRPYLLYVGNSYPYKNLMGLVEAFNLLSKQQPDLKLVLAGREDVFFEPVKQRINKLGLPDKIVRTGFVTDGELVSLYQQCALFVFPSLSEGFGLPPLEAMSYGAPVISSDASCMPEVLGSAAAYFDAHDPSDMAAKINALLDNPAELARLRQAGPKQAAKYSWGRMAEETLAVYQAASKKAR
jgi:glycosyltransferase involved in cell wall biosynthesis